jgi:hypothetical protein
MKLNKQMKTTMALAVLSIAVPTQAATLTSVGNGDYSTASTWDTNTSPGVLDDIIITNGHAITETSAVKVGFVSGGAAGPGGSISVLEGSLIGAFELNMGWVPPTSGTMDAELNIASLGTVEIAHMWLYDGPQGESDINFTGNGGSLTITDGFGAAGTVRVGTNPSTFATLSYEDLWDLGLLTKDGQSGLTSAVYLDNFAVSGTSNNTITAIPEPSAAALFGLGGLALILRRRK